MLNDHGPENTGMEMAKKERCRPDYESMINNLQAKLKRTATFADAALEYFEGRTAKNEMAELIGELVTRRDMLTRELAMLIKQQEEDPEE